MATPSPGVNAPNVSAMKPVPDLIETAAAQAAIRLAQSTESPSVFNHSVRSYLFAELLAARDGLRPGSDYDSEALFLGCVLHDLGVGTAAPGKSRFEVEGADLAAALLTEHGCGRDVVDGVWEAIALHTSGGIAERRGALCHLVRSGVGADFGRNADFIDEQTATAIHQPLPATVDGQHFGGRDRRACPAQPRRGTALLDAERPAARTADRWPHPDRTHGLTRPVGRLTRSAPGPAP